MTVATGAATVTVAATADAAAAAASAARRQATRQARGTPNYSWRQKHRVSNLHRFQCFAAVAVGAPLLKIYAPCNALRRPGLSCCSRRRPPRSLQPWSTLVLLAAGICLRANGGVGDIRQRAVLIKPTHAPTRGGASPHPPSFRRRRRSSRRKNCGHRNTSRTGCA